MKIELWESHIPLYKNDGDVPAIHYYPTEKKQGDGAVVIFPGGAYHHRAPHEGERCVPYVQSWAKLLEEWLRLNGFLNQI